MLQIQSVRRSLQAQAQVNNPILMYSAVRLRLRLMDACPAANREIDLAMLALKHNAVEEMLRLNKVVPTEVLIPKLIRWLMKDADVEEGEASWAVNSWAMAFGLIPFSDEPFVSGEVFNEPTNQPDKIRLEGHTQFITAICFNSQGTLIASSSWDGTVRLWDMNNLPNHRILTPHSPREFKVHKERILRSVAFDASGALVAAADSDGSIWLWNTHDGAEVAALTGQLRSVNCITFSRDKYLLAGCSLDNTVCLWDLELGQEPIWSREFEYMPECVAISPDSTLVALATKGMDILILDIATGATIRVLQGHTVTVRSVAFTPNGRTLISVSGDGTVRLWYVHTGLQTRLLNVTHQAVDYESVCRDDASFKLSCVAVSPDGELIAAGDFNEMIYLWRVHGVKTIPFMRLHGHAAVVSGVAFSPDGKWLTSSSWDQTICLWDLVTLPNLATIRQPNTLLPSAKKFTIYPDFENSWRDSARPFQQLSDRAWQLLLREVHSDSLLHFLWFMKDLKLAKDVMRNMSLSVADTISDDLIIKFQGCDPDKLKPDDNHLKRGRESVTEFISVLNRLKDEGQI